MPERYHYFEYGITRTEHDVYMLVKKGRSNREISDELCIAYKTAKWHLESIFKKLGVKSRFEIMAGFPSRLQLVSYGAKRGRRD